MEEDFKKIEERIHRISFSITNIPIADLNEFKDFCRQECGNVYWVGLKQLLKIKKEHETLLPLLLSMQQEISEIKDNQTKKVREEPRTFHKT